MNLMSESGSDQDFSDPPPDAVELMMVVGDGEGNRWWRKGPDTPWRQLPYRSEPSPQRPTGDGDQEWM